jgi:hypothetical protein
VEMRVEEGGRLEKGEGRREKKRGGRKGVVN